MKNITYILYILLFAVISTACEKDNTNDINVPQKVKITESQFSNGLKITLWADQQELTVGYNPIYISLSNASGTVTGKTVHIHPEMDMHSMSHSSPVEQPQYNSISGLYAGAVVFTMHSGEMGSWKLIATVDGQSTTLNITINNPPAGNKKVTSFTGEDGKAYTLSLVEPSTPKIGLNDLEILINRRIDMDTFPTEEGLTIEFEPDMPSMGHGSPNNVHPVGTGKGRYKGKVNFTMTGEWRLQFTIKRGEDVIKENVALELTF